MLSSVNLEVMPISLPGSQVLTASGLEVNRSVGVLNFAQTSKEINKAPTSETDFGLYDPYWEDVAIDASRWDKTYPYQLLVLRAGTNERGEVSYSVDDNWMFTLPITPEELTISTPSASTVTATLGGIVEESGGAPFRIISMRGTTGVTPAKGSAASQTGVPDGQAFTGGLFAGTIQNFAQTVQTNAARLGFPVMNLIRVTDPVNPFKETGYYQFHLLRTFLESYQTLKKSALGADRRLALAIWKDQQIFLVTPQTFELRRTANDPWAYNFTIVLKAWKRVKVTEADAAASQSYKPAAFAPALLQSVLGTIAQARDALESARSLMSSVRGDTGDILDVARQTVLALKEATGTTATLADLPESIVKEAMGAYNHTALTAAYALTADRKKASALERDIKMAKTRNNGGAVAFGGRSALMRSRAAPSVRVFDNPTKNFSFLNTLSLSAVEMKPSLRRMLNDELTRVRRLSRLDFEKFRDRTLDFLTGYANSVGLGSASYNDAYGQTPAAPIRVATESDYIALAALNELVTQYSRLAVASPAQAGVLRYLDVYAGFARRSGIAFTRPASKLSVPFPYGATLEQVALRYLGNANRWLEIAALNGLRSPYVDEEGFELSLLSDGLGNEVSVESVVDLYVGQLVTVLSDSQRPTKRRITKIRTVSDNLHIVTLDGEADLDRFSTMANARIHTYLPDTVNSQQMLFVPSDIPVDEELTSRDIPGVNAVTGTIERGGVDLLLTPSGDMALTSDGDWLLAVGQANILQRVRIAFGTPRGSLVQHPSYGVGLEPGTSLADIDAQQTLQAVKGMFAGDPDFVGVNGVKVEKRGPTMSVKLSIGIAGTSASLPVSLDVQR